LQADHSTASSGVARRQYLRHFLIILSGNGAAQVLNLLGYPLLARLYSPHEFGAFGLFVAASAVPGALASARLEYAMPTAPEDGAPGVLWLGLGSSAAIGLVSFLISSLIWPSPIEPILFGLCVFLTGGCASYSAFLMRHERYRAASTGVAVRTAAAILVQAALGFVGGSAINLMTGYTCGLAAQAVMFTILAVVRLRPSRPRFSTMKAMLIRYRQQVSIDVPNALIASLFFNILTFVLAALYDQRTVGYYAMGYRLAGVPFTVFIDALAQVFFQKAARAKEAKGHLWDELKFGLFTAGLISFGVLIAIWLFARPAIDLVLGPRWRPAADMLMVLAPMIAIRGAVLSISPTVFVLKRTAWLFTYSLVAILLTLVAVAAALLARLGPIPFLAIASALWSVEAAIFGAALVYAARKDRLVAALPAHH